MLESHYALSASMRLNATSVEADENLLSFGVHDLSGMRNEQNLSPAADLREAAANLFAMMRLLDDGADRIAVMPIPDDGLGLAINAPTAWHNAANKPSPIPTHRRPSTCSNRCKSFRFLP